MTPPQGLQGLDLHAPGLRHDPDWYRTAVFYEVLVRAFSDSNGSGSGDFTGLIGRLVGLRKVDEGRWRGRR